MRRKHMGMAYLQIHAGRWCLKSLRSVDGNGDGESGSGSALQTCPPTHSTLFTHNAYTGAISGLRSESVNEHEDGNEHVKCTALVE